MMYTDRRYQTQSVCGGCELDRSYWVAPPKTRRALAVSLLLFISLFASLNQQTFAEGSEDSAECIELGYEEKVTCLNTVLEENPCDAEAFVTLTWLMAEHNEWEELMASLEYLSFVAPDKPHFIQMRAQILMEHYKDRAAADIEMKKAEGLERCLLTKEEIVLSPIPPTVENAEMILERATIRFSDLKDYGGAVQDFETYLGLVERPKGPHVFYFLAGARRQLGDISGAIDALSLEMDVFPETSVSVLRTRARLYREIGDEVRAGLDLAEVERLTLEHNQWTIERIGDRIAIRPEDVSAYLERGKLKIKVGDYQGAVDDSDQALKLAPDLAAAYELRAKARIKLGDLEGARADREISSKLIRDAKKRQKNRVN